MYCMNLLKKRLKRRGLRQSPCNTPRRTGIAGVWNLSVMIQVLKSRYKLEINDIIIIMETFHFEFQLKLQLQISLLQGNL